MRKRILYCLLLILACSGVKASVIAPGVDTNATWSVIYNGREVLAIKMAGINTYLIDSIGDNDKILVDYYPNDNCEKCHSRLQFRDENGKVLATMEKEGYGAGAPFAIPGKQFRELIHNHKISLFYSAKPDEWTRWRLLGVIKTAR